MVIVAEPALAIEAGRQIWWTLGLPLSKPTTLSMSSSPPSLRHGRHCHLGCSHGWHSNEEARPTGSELNSYYKPSSHAVFSP
ncbi:hypothetical protein E2562_035039 [Oryza meyeriana var. granulata]|uniref:Uncharacterized protein n=1 Tax=Oryza meyeriana var. granulata TaxID=110450 RepID=A0A6G1EDA8_9ORYZ|nr:hypothetical protein E2562_035039 [Oryza meyeriana var. granulata]